MFEGLPLTCVFSALPKQIRQFFNVFTQWKPGDGAIIIFWEHDWGEGHLRSRLPNLYSFTVQAGVSLQNAATEQHIKHWFRPNLSIMAQEELDTLQNIKARIILRQDTRDEIIWKLTTKGIFTVKSAYTCLKEGPKIRTPLSKIWKVKAPPRIKIFAWLAAQNKILTHDNLQKRGWSLVSRCLLCQENAETVRHLFEECSHTMRLYAKLRRYRPAQNWPIKPTVQITNKAKVGKLTHKQKSAMLIMQFVLWRERCACCFTENHKHIDDLMEEIKGQLRLYEPSVTQVHSSQYGCPATREE